MIGSILEALWIFGWIVTMFCAFEEFGCDGPLEFVLTVAIGFFIWPVHWVTRDSQYRDRR
jgi:hypothetical protein